MAVKGVFASDDNVQASRKGDFASALLFSVPTGSAPLLALSAGMQSKDAVDTIVHWFEENHLSGRINVTNNAGVGPTWVLDDPSQVIPGLIYLVESTGELVYIESITGDTATVYRGLGDTNPTSIDGSSTPVPVQRIATAFEEGSGRPVAMANLGFPRFNYMQNFRNAWDVTGTTRAVEYHIENPVAKNKRDAALFHAEDMERAIHFGRKTIGTQNGKPFRLMDGIRAQIVTHVQAQAASVTWDDLDSFLRGIFETNIKGKPNERIALCGNSVIQVLNKIARLDGQIELTPGETEFGLKIVKWLTPYGDITLLTHPLYNENPTWTKDLLVLHPGAMRTRWLRRTFEDNYDRGGTRAGVDADFGILTSEMCVEYMAEKTGGLYTGIDTAAAST